MWDTVLPGFGIRISYGGKRSYFVMTRINGKQRRLAVGNAALIGLAEASETARGLLRDAATGIDPKEKERAERRTVQKAKRGTFRAIADLYMAEHGSKRKSCNELQRKLDVDILPEIGHLPIVEITRADIKQLLLKKAETSPVAANRLLALIRPVFIYAEDEEYLEAIPNFRKLVQQEKPRDRVLTDDELRDVWRGCLYIGYPYGNLVRFALLTAQRRGEIAGLVRGEVNGDGWKLPSERSKNGIGHLVPISELAQSVLDDCPSFKGTELLFAGWRRIMHNGEERLEPCQIAGWSKYKKKLDKAILNIRREEAQKAGIDVNDVKPLPHWTIHDLRRTAATGMQSLGLSDETIDRVLNHVLPGVRKRYNQFSRDPEKKTALDAWGRHVDGILSKKPIASNVIGIQKVRNA
jgi:integrase